MGGRVGVRRWEKSTNKVVRIPLTIWEHPQHISNMDC